MLESRRELLNDVSWDIAQPKPDHVGNPTDPILGDVIRDVAQKGVDPRVKAALLVDLVEAGWIFPAAVLC